MSHPFEVGKTYRNRNGEYVVEAIDGNKMRIHYVNGGALTTDVSIQARIWENIQFERQLARAEERRRQAEEARTVARQRAGQAGQQARSRPVFEGFNAEDFGDKQRGVSWAGRRELGRALAFELSRRTRVAFDHWIVPYQSEIHVARKDRYDGENRELNAAFFVTTSEDGVSYGLHVGRPGGKVKDAWPWTALVSALSDERRVRDTMHSAMEEHELTLMVYAMEVSYGQVARITVDEEGFLWQHESPEQEIARRMSGEELAEYLQGVAPNKRCDVYLGRQVSREKAIGAGTGIVDEIAEICLALLPVYDASSGG
jgi:hypothetical protein